MTQEIILYSVKGWISKKYFLERIVSISIRDGDPEIVLQKHANELKERWSAITHVTWDKL